MPSINLPTIDFTVSSGSNKQELEQIMDTLTRYRKELNFLLMNLDGENMPAIAGYIEDAFGNISSIQQTIDGINITVADALGDISSLQVQSDNISAFVGNNAGDIASLVIRTGLIETMVGDNAGDISTLTQTAQAIQTQVSNNAGAISTVTQTAQGIQTQVTNNEGQISSVVQTVNGIQSTVTSHTTELGSVYSTITQLSTSLSSKVSYSDYTGTQIVSLIEQSPSSIKLSANRIDLTGMTTLYGYNYGDRIEVNNGRVDMYFGGDRMLMFDSYSNGGAISSPSGSYIIIDDRLLVYGNATFDYSATFNSSTYFKDYVKFDQMPNFNGKDATTSNRELNILQTSYGITIQGYYGDKTLAWD